MCSNDINAFIHITASGIGSTDEGSNLITENGQSTNIVMWQQGIRAGNIIIDHTK